MKKILLFANLLFFTGAFAQTKTITLKPDSTQGKDAVVFSRTDAKAKNYGKAQHQSAATWTWDADGLGQGTFRSLIEFNLDSLPKNLRIVSAKLKLYHYNAVLAGGSTQPHKSPNASTLFRITQNWDENTVTWNAQPPVSNAGIAISGVSGTSNLEIDVTSDVQDMYLHSSSNYGWLLKNNTESPYVGVLVASSDNKDSKVWPELILEVENCKQIISLQPFNGAGIDAEISDRKDLAATNRGNVNMLAPYAWTWNGDGLGSGTMRSFFKFDLSAIPSGAIIDTATLSLYAFSPNGISDNGGHTSLTHSNASTINRAKQGWEENSITWNNQPPVESTPSETLPQSTSKNQSYTVDLTSDVADMYSNPSQNFGWCIKLIDESHYSGLFFYSSDVDKQELAPKLEVRYTLCDRITPVTTFDVTTTKVNSVFPNPSQSGVFEFTNEVTGVVYSINGIEVAKINNSTKIDLSNQEKGIYFIKTTSGDVFKVMSK